MLWTVVIAMLGKLALVVALGMIMWMTVWCHRTSRKQRTIGYVIYLVCATLVTFFAGPLVISYSARYFVLFFLGLYVFLLTWEMVWSAKLRQDALFGQFGVLITLGILIGALLLALTGSSAKAIQRTTDTVSFTFVTCFGHNTGIKFRQGPIHTFPGSVRCGDEEYVETLTEADLDNIATVITTVQPLQSGEGHGGT